MTSYILGWLAGGETKNPPNNDRASPEVNIVVDVDAPPDCADGGDESDSDRSDTPPAFPSLNSAQRLGGTISSASSSKSMNNGLPKILSDTLLMPPPPLPNKALRVPGVPQITSTSSSSRSISSSTLSVPGSSSSMLSLPPSTTKPPVKKVREKVALAPGFGPLDWAALKASGTDLRVRVPFFDVRKDMLIHRCVFVSCGSRALTRSFASHPPCSKSTNPPTTPGLQSAGKFTT